MDRIKFSPSRKILLALENFCLAQMLQILQPTGPVARLEEGIRRERLPHAAVDLYALCYLVRVAGVHF
jgi:hypothetical protein